MAEKEVKGIKKFFEEFKAFAMRGNVLDMAIGVVIGGAFTAIVNSLVNDIINPAIGLFFNADFSEVGIHVGDVMIGIGSFINAIINFLIVAFVLFVVIKTINALHKKPAEPEAPAEPTTKVCPYCQSEISIKAVRCPHCTSKLEGFPEIALIAFNRRMVDFAAGQPGAREITKLHYAVYEIPVYALKWQGRDIAVCVSFEGSGGAAMVMEELIALGARAFLAIGSCGCLDAGIAEGHLIVPTAAYRDEGASYHLSLIHI